MTYLTDYRPPLSTADAYRQEVHMRETRDERANRAHSDLIDEFTTAAMRDADTPVRCPSDNGVRGTMTAGEIVLDAIGGADVGSWGLRRKLLEVIALAAKSTDVTVRMPAMAFLAQVGKEYADLHAGELAEQTL